MFCNIKSSITELAYAAVNMAEDTLDTASGKDKKEAAIEYVVSMLPIAFPLKKIVSMILSKFIDNSIEKAVSYMKSVKNTNNVAEA